MKIYNTWVGYLQRSHLTIKNAVLKKLGKTNPEMTDHSESNILVIIVSIFSGIAEQLNYYIDNMAREAFISTARKYSSVVRHTKLIDYRIKTNNPASVDVIIQLFDHQNNPYQLPESITIPVNTIFQTSNGLEYLCTRDIVVPPGRDSIVVPTEQKVPYNNIELGITNNLPHQMILLPSNYVDNSLVLIIGGENWTLKNTLGFSGPNDKDYIVEVEEDNNAYIKFGDNINGAIPPGNKGVIGFMYLSEGAAGNIQENLINQTDIDIVNLTGCAKYNITNPQKASGGTNYESLESIRYSAPLSLRTLERAVTKQDYQDLAVLTPGVAKANVEHRCGEPIQIYISPEGGGIAQTPLLLSTKQYLEQRKILGTFINVQAAGEGYIRLELDVTLRPRRDSNKAQQDIKDKLITEYGYNKVGINQTVRLSDIYALVDNLEQVDFLNIKRLSLIPYCRPNNHYQQLIWKFEMKAGITDSQDWYIKYVDMGSTQYFQLFENHQYVGNINLEEPYEDPSGYFKVVIFNNGYIGGQTWNFQTLPTGGDLIIKDNSVPIIKEENLVVNIIEQ